MDNIQIFSNNEFGEIRTIIIDNEPFFVGNDCAKALGYKNLYNGISKNVDEDDRRIFPVGSTSGTQDTTIVQKDETLKKGCRKFAAGVLDKGNETIAIRIDFIPI